MPLPSFERLTATAAADDPFVVLTVDRWYSYADIFVLSQNCYFGDKTDQDIPLDAGDCYSINRPVNIKDLFFKNAVAGNNTKIVIVGTPIDPQLMQGGRYAVLW
jgi:hypothetical protein